MGQSRNTGRKRQMILRNGNSAPEAVTDGFEQAVPIVLVWEFNLIKHNGYRWKSTSFSTSTSIVTFF